MSDRFIPPSFTESGRRQSLERYRRRQATDIDFSVLDEIVDELLREEVEDKILGYSQDKIKDYTNDAVQWLICDPEARGERPKSPEGIMDFAEEIVDNVRRGVADNIRSNLKALSLIPEGGHNLFTEPSSIEDDVPMLVFGLLSQVVVRAVIDKLHPAIKANIEDKFRKAGLL